MFFSCAFFANFFATNFDNSILFTLSTDFRSFSTEEADNKVTFFESSIICAEIFLEDLNILSLNLSGFETFLSLFVILNFFSCCCA